MQYRRLNDQFAITIHDVPFDVISVLFAVGGLLILGGMVIRRYDLPWAQAVAGITAPLSVVTVLVGFIGSVCSGVDLLASLQWNWGVPMLLWPLIVVIAIALVAVVSKNPGPTSKACSVFLLVKGFYIASAMLASAYTPPMLESALVPAYFLTLTSLTCAFLVTLGYVLYSCPVRSTSDEMDKLAVAIDPVKEINAPMTDNPLSGREYGDVGGQKTYGYDQDDTAVVGAYMNVGVPIVTLF